MGTQGKVLIIGSTGQLGNHLKEFLSRDYELVLLNHEDIQVENLDSVKKQILLYQPEIVINTSAYHVVDECETNPDKSFQVNALGARNLAIVCQKLNATLVHFSSDYVFDGKNMPSLGYTEFDVTNPVNVYARSKQEGEKYVQSLCSKHFLIRTSWLFGSVNTPDSGDNFVLKMIHLMRTRDSLKIVNDQIGTPTYTADLASKVKELIATENYGLYHIANTGQTSWYEFACEIKKLAGLQTLVSPCTSQDFKTKAARPAFSALRNYMLELQGFSPMPDWKDALRRYVQLLKEEGKLQEVQNAVYISKA